MKSKDVHAKQFYMQMHMIIPSGIFGMLMINLFDLGLSSELALRLHRLKVLWLLRVHPADIPKFLTTANVLGTYAVSTHSNLDIVEAGAVYWHMKQTVRAIGARAQHEECKFIVDWYRGIERLYDSMYVLYESGELMDLQQRDPAYLAYEEDQKTQKAARSANNNTNNNGNNNGNSDGISLDSWDRAQLLREEDVLCMVVNMYASLLEGATKEASQAFGIARGEVNKASTPSKDVADVSDVSVDVTGGDNVVLHTRAYFDNLWVKVKAIHNVLLPTYTPKHLQFILAELVSYLEATIPTYFKVYASVSDSTMKQGVLEEARRFVSLVRELQHMDGSMECRLEESISRALQLHVA